MPSDSSIGLSIDCCGIADWLILPPTGVLYKLSPQWSSSFCSATTVIPSPERCSAPALPVEMAKPRVFFDIAINGKQTGRIVMEVNRYL